jgi:hypothetical protein
MKNLDRAKLEPMEGPEGLPGATWSTVDRDHIQYSIAVSLKRIGDDLEQIKNGFKFMCERWPDLRK